MDIRQWKSDTVAISDAVTIKIDYEKCVTHGNCTEVCPSDVYEIQDGKAVPIGIDDCIECCSCVESCPENAINHSACE